MEGYSPNTGAGTPAWSVRGGGEDSPSALCVLWHPRGSRPDEELVAILQKRGFRTIPCDNAIEATAWICSAYHGRRGASQPLVLLMDRPGLLLGSDDCREVVESYVPRAACWVHDPTATPRLRAAAKPPSQESAAPAMRVSFPASSGRREPSLRLTSDISHRERTPHRAMEEPANGDVHEVEDASIAGVGRGSPRNLLSDEELAMLLDDAGSAPEQPPHPQGHRHH